VRPKWRCGFELNQNPPLMNGQQLGLSLGLKPCWTLMKFPGFVNFRVDAAG
jgi:hypothetical protein